MTYFRPISIVILFLFQFNKCVFSQIDIYEKDTGKVEFVVQKAINELVETQKIVNSKATIKGYRLKIHFGSDKNKAKEVKAKFISKYPEIPAYEKYDQPNFNIRVGNFRSKLEAYKFLKEIQIEFPSAFLVQDEIEPPFIN